MRSHLQALTTEPLYRISRALEMTSHLQEILQPTVTFFRILDLMQCSRMTPPLLKHSRGVNTFLQPDWAVKGKGKDNFISETLWGTWNVTLHRMVWPINVPHVNPNENLWSELDHCVRKNYALQQSKQSRFSGCSRSGMTSRRTLLKRSSTLCHVGLDKNSGTLFTTVTRLRLCFEEYLFENAVSLTSNFV